MIALVDCNNFYASCERVFQPKLRNKPIAILSNNDGCVIARSDEAKAVGIKMGEPAHLIKDVIQKNNVEVFSSNYTLYGDMSNRVMQNLSNFTPRLEIYSIDEAFLDFSGMNNLENYSIDLRKKIRQYTGIPTCVGVAKTKTLAKIANRFAKKYYKNSTGVFVIDSEEKRIEALRSTDIEDVWGVGRQYSILLKKHGINNALDFSLTDENWIKKHMSVVGQRLLLELNEFPCLELELEPADKKNICTSRSFGKKIESINLLSEATATFAANCAYKLRKQESVCNFIHVFVQTNFFNKSEPQYNNSITVTLPVASSDSRIIIKYAMIALQKIFKPGFKYKKSGVIVSGIVPEKEIQLNMFSEPFNKKHHNLMLRMDKLNERYGREKVKIAKQGFDRTWRLKNEKLSKCFTTNIQDLLIVKC